jgi:hypothetical protein
VPADHGGEAVVDAPRHRDRHLVRQLLRRRRPVREHLHVDARLVHLAKAQVVEVVQA